MQSNLKGSCSPRAGMENNSVSELYGLPSILYINTAVLIIRKAATTYRL